MKTLYEVKTGKALTVEAVDAREILQQSPELYSSDPAPVPVEAGAKLSAGLKVDEIKAALTAKGIAFPDDAKKAELAALLDAAQ